MPRFSVNPHRVDPYKASRFRVRWSGRIVPGIVRVGGLSWALAARGGVDGATLPGGVAAPGGIVASGGPTVAQVLDPLGLFGGGGLFGFFGGGGGREAEAAPATLHARPAPVLLERGRTHDTSFEDWAEEVARDEAGRRRRAATKDVLVELHNEAGQVVLAFVLRGCLPIAYEALGELDATADEFARERLTLAYERLERDRDVTEPVEPRF